ncbi:MAG: cell wall biosynthesis glycosyltransferase [Candidatus Bathyarchaeota archaeon]|nr:cell wall biosynthesis glycosyltransferase [Candidatus Bathyarchaeota archaeon]
MLTEPDSALSTEACDHIEKIKHADLLVGIPSYNNVLTASYVISQVVKGLETYFPNQRAVIFVSDGKSVDGTLTSVKTVHLPSSMDLIPAIYVGIAGKGSAIKAVFEAARYLGVKAVALVDSDLRSITPEWMNLLLSPVLSGTGLVVPYYNRRKYDGTITNFLCYPVTTSLYGKNVRQPIGGDFGLSNGLVNELLDSPLWKLPAVREFGVDIFETHTALAKGFEVKQAFLGIKDHDPKDPTKQLTPMFRQVIGTMFTCIEQYEPAWKEIRGVDAVTMEGEEKHVNSQPPIPIDLQNMISTYKKRCDEHRSLCSSILSSEFLREFETLKNLDKSDVHFPIDVWAKTVYSFIAAFHRAEPDKRTSLVDALQVLWTGRLAAFIKETLPISPSETEERIFEQAQAFFKLKSYLADIY